MEIIDILNVIKGKSIHGYNKESPCEITTNIGGYY
jgi:hypothetical protein